MKIVISGTIGVGKSTISTLLNKTLKAKKINSFLYKEIEENDNPLLGLYYENRPEWSFIIQMEFLLKRFNTLVKNEKNLKKKSDIGIFDRHFLDDFIFANSELIKQDMSAFQLQTYFQVNKELTNKIKKITKVDFYILLVDDFESIIERVKKRGREEEKEVDVEYWRDIYNSYYLNSDVKKYLKANTKKFIEFNIHNKTPKAIVEGILKQILKK